LTLLPGARLGPYEIVAALGSGAMGDVYRARDTRIDRPVAIKILRAFPEVDLARQALAEARAAGRLNHPNIATLHDVVEGAAVDGMPLPPFLVMEFVDGRPLSSLIAEGPMDADRALGIAIQLADALAAAHRNGVIHRDVKPANVLVTAAGTVKLLDLGVARVAADPGSTTRTSVAGGFASGSAGTPAYMAPEQLAGAPADAQGDVYGLGVLLFEMLAGRRPFAGSDVLSIALHATTSPTPDLATDRPDLPHAIPRLVARAMAKAPKDRFASAAELRDALTTVRAGGDIRVPGRRSARRIWIGSTAAAITAAVLVVWLMRPAPHVRAPIAILPPTSNGDEVVQALGVGMTSMLADNLAAAPGLTIVSGAPLAAPAAAGTRDIGKAAHELGAGYVIDLHVSGTPSRVRVDGAFNAIGQDAPLWRGSQEGIPLDVNRWIADQIAGAVEKTGLLTRRPNDAERQRMRRQPTADAAAFLDYAKGQARFEAADREPEARAAVDAFEAAVARDGSFALAFAALSEACGRVYVYTRDEAWLKRATSDAARALELDPDQARVHLALGNVYERIGRLEDAVREAQQAVRLAPTSDAAHRLLGNVLLDRGDNDGAIREVSRAIDLRPDYWRNQSTLGFALQAAGRYQQAVTAYRRATDLEPSATNYQRLGTALHFAGNVQEAIGNYKHAVELSQDPSAYSNLAFSYYSAGRYEEAIAAWEESARLSKTHTPLVLQNLADAYERLDQRAKSREHYAAAIARARELLKVDPTDAGQIALVARCEAKLGNRDEAALRAAEALGLRPADKNVLYKVAVVEALGGDTDRALGHLKDALAHGYPAVFARDDFDLQPLRGDPRFVALVTPRGD
jgi:eukaryotic-like serine/threonine-protein kinase